MIGRHFGTLSDGKKDISCSNMANNVRHLDILLYPGFNLLDAAGPAQAFNEARKHGAPAYRTRFISVEGEIVTSSCGLPVLAKPMPTRARGCADILVPGGVGVDLLLGNRSVQRFLESFSLDSDFRMISVCSGALLLADAGVLNDRTATTHWSRENTVLDQYPCVNWLLDKIFVRDGTVYTSAGVTAGIDLALEIIREDCGGKEALGVARELVVQTKRPGGQSQYADLLETQLCGDNLIAELISLFKSSPAKLWRLQAMANQLNTTPRTLSRKCLAATGMSPIKLLEKVRVQVASDLFSQRLPTKRVMQKSGFSNVQSMQRGFNRHLGTTVGEYVKKFGSV